MEHDVYLVLENGKTFKGKRFGAAGNIMGEVVFTTGMTGYLETLSDKSYHGQIVVQTFPLIGNYGVIPNDLESEGPQVKAYIVKEWCGVPSNFRCEGTIHTFLKNNGIIGLYGIDTRALTKIIREHGVMNGMITDNPDTADLNRIKDYHIHHPVENVSSDSIKQYTVDNAKHHVVLYDFGAKDNIRKELMARGCNVTTVPYNTTAEEIKGLQPDGIMLSNGPGDPADNEDIIREIEKLFTWGIPMFGICLGHQLMSMARGAKTHKLKYGHRGSNQPVRDLNTGRIYITSQNHGYAVVCDELDETKAKLWFLSANDQSCEGMEYPSCPAFSVQFHPEAAAGPHDTAFLFDRFINMMGGNEHATE